MRHLIKLVFALGCVLATVCTQAAKELPLSGHVPPVVARLASLGRLPADQKVSLALGLPWRNAPALQDFLLRVSTPGAPEFRRYLTPEQFAAQFSPTEADYQAVLSFARAQGMTVDQTHPNRLLVSVTGSVADIERAFHITLQIYQHPTEARTFYAPDREPSVDAPLPLQHIAGLHDYRRPSPISLHTSAPGVSGRPIALGGTGPGGSYRGKDFRNAYIPGSTLRGAGQSLGLVAFDGYFPNDVAQYATQAGLTNIPVETILIDGFSGNPTSSASGSGNEEVALDIEMAMSMAPGLDSILVYEASPTSNQATVNNMFNRMATDNRARQISCSWGFDIDVTIHQIFQQFAAQGQSFYTASGDGGAFAGPVMQPADDPFITTVGGTVLTTSGSGAWSSETTWNGSGGGISTIHRIPEWQQGLDMSLNQGSKVMRNIPDVAMIADNVWLMADNGKSFSVSGTSIAAPLWGAFTALINEKAAAAGLPPIGFASPALYAIGKSATYTKSFHDITTGSNTGTQSPSRFFARRGYDLCTGLGTPIGNTLINALMAPPAEPLVVTPRIGFTSIGSIGGPFHVPSQVLHLTNAGAAALDWAIDSPAVWLDVVPTAGHLEPGDPAVEISVALNDLTTNLLLGAFSANLAVSNLTASTAQHLTFDLLVGNGGFETGDFQEWTMTGNPEITHTLSLDHSNFSGEQSLPGVEDFLFVHSGAYGAFLGENTLPGKLRQTIPTTPGRLYLVSFSLDNPLVGTPNSFATFWGEVQIMGLTNMAPFTWTNLTYAVAATSGATELRFEFRNDPSAWGLDDISVQPIPAPIVSTASTAEGNLTLNWTTYPGLTYRVEYSEQISPTDWQPLGAAQTADGTPLTVSDALNASTQRFYRVVIVP